MKRILLAAITAMLTLAASAQGHASANAPAPQRLAAAPQTAQPRHVTNEEFRYLPDTDTCTYILSGTVTTIRNAVAGHLYIKDETGEMQIYRIYGENGECNFGRYDVHQGDTITVMGHRSIYDFRVVEMKDARLLYFSQGPRSIGAVSPKARPRRSGGKKR